MRSSFSSTSSSSSPSSSSVFMAIAIAIANANPPVLLFFDYLLASSWTWFALLLATIATTLRALRLRFPGHRLFTVAAEASPVVIPAFTSFPDASSIGPCARASTFSSLSLQRSFKRRAGSKSTSALEKLLHKNRGGFWRSGIEFLSSVLDAELPSSLKRIASASKILHGQHAHAATHQMRGLHGKHANLGNTTLASAENNGMGSAPKQGLDAGKPSGFGLGLKFQWETPLEENEESCQRSTLKDGMCTEDCASSCMWLPSWAFSLSGPSQLRRPYHVSPTWMASPCFEKQFGWDKLLQSKLGFPWSFPSATVSSCTWQSECTMGSGNVVNVWDDLPKKLLRNLDLDEGSTLALDAHRHQGLACTSNISGQVSMWDVEHSSRTRASAAFAQPVLALSMNLEKCTTLVGSASSIGLWDQRSPSCNLNVASTLPASLSGLKSRESGLCVASADGILSMYDLRKLCGGPLVSEVAPKRHQIDDDESIFWENLTCDTEDDDEVEYDIATEVRAAESRKSGSLVSRLTMFVRAATFML